MIRSNIAAPSGAQGKAHFRVLDGWRGIAALLVALFHLNLLSPLYSLDFVRNAFLFVDFFFVLSGFVITHSYADRLGTADGVRSFAIRRFGRLWPLHVVVLTAFVLAESAKAVLAARGASFYAPPFAGANLPSTIPLNLAFLQPFGFTHELTWNPPSWSIGAEFWTYLVFAAVIFISRSWLARYRFAAEGLAALLLVLSFMTLILFSAHGIDATFDLGFVRCLYGFLVGHFCYRLWQVCPRDIFASPLIEIAVVILAFGYVATAGRGVHSFVAPLVFAMVVLVFAFEAGPVSKLMSNRVNDWLGRISYSIYMWQAFIIFNFVDRPVSIIEKLTGRALTTTDGAVSALGGEAGKLIVLGGHWLPLLATTAFVCVLVAVASVSYVVIEKPGQALFARFAASRRGPAKAVVIAPKLPA